MLSFLQNGMKKKYWEGHKMEINIAIAMVGLVIMIIYNIIMTLKVFFPKTFIRWADYFAIPIKEDELIPLLEGEEKEKSIEVKGMEVEE